MNRTLMKIVVEAVVFLSLSDDVIVDANTAVSQVEQIASFLKELAPVEQKTFIHYVEEVAQDARARGGN